jgi:adenylate cyclase
VVFRLTAPAVDILVKGPSVANLQIGDDEACVGPFRSDFDACNDPLGANRDAFDQAVALFGRAIALDPDYADPYAGVAMAHTIDFHNHWTGAAGALDRAEHFATQAIERGPTAPFAHFVAALVATWKGNFERAKEEVDATLALNPNYAGAYSTCGLIEIYSGDPMAAIPFLERGMLLDPASIQLFMHFQGSAYLLAGKYQAAAASFRERIRLAPDTDLSRALLASALGHLGEIDDARRVWAELKKISPTYSFTEHINRLPFKVQADVNRIREGLTKAGLAD